MGIARCSGFNALPHNEQATEDAAQQSEEYPQGPRSLEANGQHDRTYQASASRKERGDWVMQERARRATAT